MQILNETPFVAGWTVGFRRDGREIATVAVKGTYRLALGADGEPPLAPVQAPLLEADEFGPDPAADAPRAENDFAPSKSLCDVVVRGRAHAPGGRPGKRVVVSVEVGAYRKSLAVLGPRAWVKVLGEIGPSAPVAFVTQEISYDIAFGGTDADPDNPSAVKTYLSNPSGVGYCPSGKNLDALPPPCTEEVDQPVTTPTGRYRPMAFGPIGRNWEPRSRFVGTYDERWQRSRMPFLPEDFDERYFQAVPPDQQIAHPRGGEPITLVNLSERGTLRSAVPREGVSVSFIRRSGELVQTWAKLDTILLEPEAENVSFTWRASCALHRDPFELREILVDLASRHSLGKLRARATGKTYHSGLADLARARGKGARR